VKAAIRAVICNPCPYRD